MTLKRLMPDIVHISNWMPDFNYASLIGKRHAGLGYYTIEVIFKLFVQMIKSASTFTFEYKRYVTCELLYLNVCSKPK